MRLKSVLTALAVLIVCSLIAGLPYLLPEKRIERNIERPRLTPEQRRELSQGMRNELARGRGAAASQNSDERTGLDAMQRDLEARRAESERLMERSRELRHAMERALDREEVPLAPE
jgi:hypothetical protein